MSLGKNLILAGILLLIHFLNPAVFAQEEISDAELEDLIEILVADSEDNIDYDTYLERLTYFNENPVNLNKASSEDLFAIGLLTPLQVGSLVYYRDKIGKLINIYELQAIPNWDLATIRRILPFVRIKGEIDDFNVRANKLLFNGKHQLFMRYSRVLEEQKGYTQADTSADGSVPSRYLGSQDKLYARYKYGYGQKISYGITAEKDAGEEFFGGSQPNGFDFYSAHFYLADVGPFSQIIIGDYEMRLGQGLTVWNSLGFGKSAYVMNVKRQGAHIRPYTSVHEVNFLRGAAATVDITDDLSFTAFGSIKPIDVNVVAIDTLTDEVISISAINEFGAHRTPSELNTKGAVNQSDIGAHVQYEKRRFGIGASVSYNKYDKPIFRADNPYNRFRFSGDSNLNYSVDYRLLVGNLHFFGETAFSNYGGMASINGVLASLHPTIDLSIVQRYYGRDYEAPYSNAFSESSTIVNESGVFMGAEIRPIKNWTVRAYFDIYNHDWLRFRTDAPSTGADKLIQVDYKPSRSLVAYARFKTETKDRNLSGNSTNTDYTTPTTVSGLRFNLKYKLNKSITLKSRMEFSWFDDEVNPVEKGFMAYQEFSYKPLSFPLSFDIRYMLFDTDGYDTRIYTYEKDVLYFFSIPAYFDQGRRYYITARYKLMKGIDCWLRFSQTTFYNRNSIGGGLEEIDGNKRSEVKVQVRFKF